LWKDLIIRKLTKTKKVSSAVILFTGLFSGIIGIMLIYAILYFISALRDDTSITNSNKWYIISWIPAEILIVIFFATWGIILGAVVTIIFQQLCL
jgi:hypothetical protein